MKYILTIVYVFAATTAYAEFNRTSGLIDIPAARILPHMGYRIGLDGTVPLGSAPGNEDFEGNIHMALGLGDRLEVYLDVLSFSDFTPAIGFCHNLLGGDVIALSWGIHQLSYALDISEVGHGDSTGWHDDLMYYAGDYEKPFELGSAFIVATYSATERSHATIGIGRGRYVGYGTHSHYFNSNFHHEKGGDWALGLIAGVEILFSDRISFLFEGDSRDLNLGLKFRFLPVEIGIAVSKFEWVMWSDMSDYQPRFAASISYLPPKKEEQPVYGMIAGTVYDTQGAVIAGKVSILDSDYEPGIIDPDVGTYNFMKVGPGVYELFASAKGYVGSGKIIKVIAGETTICDFALFKEIPKTGNINGKVVDLKTNEPLIVRLSIPETDKTTESEADGDFEFTALAPGIYNIKAEALDYETGVYPVVVYEGKQSDLLIKMVKQGMVITLKGVKFDLNKATLRPESYPILDEAAGIITNHPEISVEIQGHTCSLGSESHNLELSAGRANSVRDYLIEKNMIEPHRLIARGYGETQPVADNRTELGRRQNRRVDFVVLKD
ncbi:MAG: OmpA family protein [bacterium]